MDIILASTSPYRRALLDRLGLPFRTIAPTVDEAPYKARGMDPRLLAEMLALDKAGSVAHGHPDAIVIGSDQVAEVNGRILDKPGTAEVAVAQLRSLSGRQHRLITSIAVVCSTRNIVTPHTDVTTLWMRSLDDDAIRRYVEADRPLDCAGSYKLEARGIALFERIDSADHTAIVGLPLIALTTILRSLGVEIP